MESLNLSKRKRKLKLPEEVLIEDLEISTRLYHFLDNLNIKTLKEILNISEEEIQEKVGFNFKFLDEIKYLKDKNKF